MYAVSSPWVPFFDILFINPYNRMGFFFKTIYFHTVDGNVYQYITKVGIVCGRNCPLVWMYAQMYSLISFVYHFEWALLQSSFKEKCKLLFIFIPSEQARGNNGMEKLPKTILRRRSRLKRQPILIWVTPECWLSHQDKL